MEKVYKVRPLSTWDNSLEKASLKGASRIYISRGGLEALVESPASGNGSPCIVERTSTDSSEPTRREATVWIQPGKNLSPNIVMMSTAYREACGFKLEDKVRIRLSSTASVPDAEQVELEHLATSELEESLTPTDVPGWEWVTRGLLDRAEHVFPGMVFQDVMVTAQGKKSFRVTSVNSQQDNVARFGKSTTVRIRQPQEVATGAVEIKDLVAPTIPGLRAEENQLNDFFRGFAGKFASKGERISCGIVIHGGRGNGKTFILDRIAELGWGKVYRVGVLDKSSNIQEVFKLARAQQPSIILIDRLQDLLSKDRPNHISIAEQLSSELDGLAREARATNMLPKVVVVAACLDYMVDVPVELRKRTRFEKNIILPVPNADGRLDILKHIGPPVEPNTFIDVVTKLAQDTYAYNASDLDRLVRKAQELMRNRLLLQGKALESEDTPYLLNEELDQALRSTRPTTMHDIRLKPPTVHWQDIGGHESLKNTLNKMIMLTTTTNPLILRHTLGKPKGLLLYGPPGCSKTLSAQAMATESGFNFFSVKGAELLNMYVGESERAVRQLFERARAAAPSIIFFDEIDSIGGQRDGLSGNRSQVSTNVLTSLLTEMDGFEALAGVLVLAATNRPEAIDPALIRPGRFDQAVYVGIPGHAAREAIFRLYLSKIASLDATDIDITELAEKSDGFSGAEIKEICVRASNRAIDELLELESAGLLTESTDDGCLRMEHLLYAFHDMRKGITKEMLEGFETWSEQFLALDKK